MSMLIILSLNFIIYHSRIIIYSYLMNHCLFHSCKCQCISLPLSLSSYHPTTSTTSHTPTLCSTHPIYYFLHELFYSSLQMKISYSTFSIYIYLYLYTLSITFIQIITILIHYCLILTFSNSLNSMTHNYYICTSQMATATDYIYACFSSLSALTFIFFFYLTNSCSTVNISLFNQYIF